MNIFKLLRVTYTMYKQKGIKETLDQYEQYLFDEWYEHSASYKTPLTQCILHLILLRLYYKSIK